MSARAKASKRLPPPVPLSEEAPGRYRYKSRFGEHAIIDSWLGGYELAICNDESAAIMITEAMNFTELQVRQGKYKR